MAKLIIEIDEKTIDKAHAFLAGELTSNELVKLSQSEISITIAEIKSIEPSAEISITSLFLTKYLELIKNSINSKKILVNIEGAILSVDADKPQLPRVKLLNSWEIYWNAAMNPNIPPEILAELEKDITIRFFVASNPNTSVEIITKSAKDGNFKVRYAVAINPSTPLEILEELLKDSDDDVRRAAKAHIEIKKARHEEELRH